MSDDSWTKSWTTATTPELKQGNELHLNVLADGRLVLLWKLDAFPQDLLVSTGSDWRELEICHFVGSTRPGWKYFDVNSAGIATVPTYIPPCLRDVLSRGSRRAPRARSRSTTAPTWSIGRTSRRLVFATSAR